MFLLASKRSRYAAYTLITSLFMTGTTISAAFADPGILEAEELKSLQSQEESFEVSASPSQLEPRSGTLRATGDLRVTSEADSGPGTLREAVELANLDSDPDAVVIDPGLTIMLDTDVEIKHSISIIGDAASPALIRAAPGLAASDAPQLLNIGYGGNQRIDITIAFVAFSGESTAVRGIVDHQGMFLNKLELLDVEMRDFGLSALGNHSMYAQELVISRFTLSGSGGPNEPAVDVGTGGAAPSSVTDSTFSANPGAIQFSHQQFSTHDNFRFANNSVLGSGNEAEHCLVLKSTLVDPESVPSLATIEVTNNNVSGCRAEEAALYVGRVLEAGDFDENPPGITIENNTFSDNVAGGGAEARADSLFVRFPYALTNGFDLEMRNNTFSGEEHSRSQVNLRFDWLVPSALVTHNTFVGGGISLDSRLHRADEDSHDFSLVADNNAFDTGSYPAIIDQTDEGRTFDIQGSGNAATTPGEHFPTESVAAMTSAEMALAPLSENDTQTGTLTRMPEKGSRLIDAGVATEYSPATDQRGLPRPIGNAPDVGAVETAYPLAPSVLALTEDVTVPEGTDAVFTVSRTGPSDEAVSVTVTTAPDTAIAGTDYIHTEIVLEWAADDTASKTVTVPTVKDEKVRDSRAFTVSLSAPSEHAELGTPASARGTITDSSTATPPAEKPDEEDGPSASPPPGGATPPLSNTGSGADTPLLILSAVALLVGAGFLVLRRFAHAR